MSPSRHTHVRGRSNLQKNKFLLTSITLFTVSYHLEMVFSMLLSSIREPGLTTALLIWRPYAILIINSIASGRAEEMNEAFACIQKFDKSMLKSTRFKFKVL